jgi:BCD family chlorophyll transporter-like MFS transporter
MAVLGLGGVLAAAATAWMGTALVPGIALAVVAFLLVGVGVGAAGTSLLVLLASRVAPARRPAAASLVWIMMIAGFVLTTAISGRLLDPYSGPRLVAVAAGVSVLAFLLSLVAVAGIEGPSPARREATEAKTPFGVALRQVWAEPEARQFTIFVFVSMLAYSAQDLILEPFAGTVFGMTLGETTRLSSLQHGGVLAGMILIAIVGSLSGGRVAVLRAWTVGGCLTAALLLAALAGAGMAGADFPIRESFFALGVANGAFAAAAIASMMQLVSRGRDGREGVRMGMFGAAQAIAFGAGGLAGTVVLDIGRLVTGSAGGGYVTVFIADGLLFLASAALALRIGRPASTKPRDFGPMTPAASGS